MLVSDFLRVTKARHKNIAAFKNPNRKPKIWLRTKQRNLKIALKKLTRADITKCFKD